MFKIISIKGNIAVLNGVDIRLYADALLTDLSLDSGYDNRDELDEAIICDDIINIKLNRSEYFYLPGSILHIDGDNEYLNRCMKLYKKMNVKAFGYYIPEPEMSIKIYDLLQKYHPDILVITGHDSFHKKGKDIISDYQNTSNFVDAVKEARKFERNQDKLIVIAGACQSKYEDLIRAGANFASSPKRINIHALDPAILAVSLSFSDKNKSIDLINIIKKTKYGSDGVGGIITNGTMYVGYPR